MNTSTINKTPKIIGLRSTIFLNTPIGYNAENEIRYKELLPKGKVKNVFQPNYPGAIVGPSFNDAWQIVDKEKGYNIVFIQNKVDIIWSNKNYAENTFNDFISFTIESFDKIMQSGGDINRLAFSPTYIYEKNEDFEIQEVWNKIFKTTMISGNVIKDINCQYLMKDKWEADGITHSINILHQWSDALKTDNTNGNREECVLLTLDINTVPVPNFKFSNENMHFFFENIYQKTLHVLENY